MGEVRLYVDSYDRIFASVASLRLLLSFLGTKGSWWTTVLGRAINTTLCVLQLFFDLTNKNEVRRVPALFPSITQMNVRTIVLAWCCQGCNMVAVRLSSQAEMAPPGWASSPSSQEG
ncbi:hypothetical protein XELAEV_18046388mg [Xenopus laevis]|uniref:Uncharacterized protein n=1 Tax=Xenopus laevis TaxID=8355 RepID=A0A974BT81_XENLA|nr:hypothetical protein XELAEV_18046388mg [Xenopus laevis]